MQPPQGPYSSDPYGAYPPQQSQQPQDSPWEHHQQPHGFFWEQPQQASSWAQQPQEGSQWVQRPLPGQTYSAGPVPGQAPPPAQIVDPAQPGYVYPGQQPYLDAPQTIETQPGSPADGQPYADGPEYKPPTTGLPRGGQRRVKRSSVALIVIALCILVTAVILLLGRQGPGGRSYGYVRSGSVEARFTGDAVIVRNEVVYPAVATQIEYVAEEGSMVARGNIVATIYTSGFRSQDLVTLQDYQNQIKAYQKVLIEGASTDAKLLSLMTTVRSRALEVQRLVQGEQGSISAQEKLLNQAMQDQQTYIRQKYPDDQKLSRLNDDENTQRQKISQWTKQFAAQYEGLVSFYTDGYENSLNMLTYGDFSPAEVRDMYNGRVPDTEETLGRNMTNIYRLVRQEPWVVLMLCNEREWTPTKGRSYKLLIENFDNIIVDATVDSFTLSGGELLVRLVVDNTAALPNVLYLRSCQVQLGENVSTLQVPSRAIYVQNGRKGVVMYTEGGEYWTGVEVVSDDGNYAYVIPDKAGVLYDGIPVRLF